MTIAAAPAKRMTTSAMRMEVRLTKMPCMRRDRSIRTAGRSGLSGGSFQNDGRHRVMLSVTECDQRRGDAPLCSKLQRWTAQNQKWFAARFFLDVDVAPTHRLADASPECLRNSLFCRETRSQMTSRELHRHGVFNLAVCKNASEKTIAKSIDGSLNAVTLDKIN